MSEYRLDRTAFKAQTAEEAADHHSYYKDLSLKERLDIVDYLNSIAYNYPLNDPPKMDRTAFSMRGRKKNG
ncbi:hypothetical protein [Mucilaginibacter psychrotolerans]|uniref:Cytochrome c n=1 Tax=Mucilaginibacter psychrotolerans TaxID=1524096 RepID=A0A4Y8S3I8_9SPHI|nr:hypothetical protein [Mucilaginibacter psychrotolerans]TFF33538.1 hypothetical protein E2R66_25530 [Mucilaginibacter psychrotolerans]